MAEHCNGECRLCSMSFMLSVTRKPFMVSVILLNVIMLNVVAPFIFLHFTAELQLLPMFGVLTLALLIRYRE